MAVFHRHSPFSVRAGALIDHITCFLCRGYLVEATTITECLHTFCRSCIVKHITQTLDQDKRERCPICNVIIKEAQPLAGLRPDRTLQDIIDAILPQVREEEERRERLYNDRQHIESKFSPTATRPPLSKHTPDSRSILSTDEEKVSLLIRPSNLSARTHSSCDTVKLQKHLRCSSRMTVLHMKRFVLEKTGWYCDNCSDHIEIRCKGSKLRDELTLEFIWRIRWADSGPVMVLEYEKRNEIEVTARRKRRRASVCEKDEESEKREEEMHDGESRKSEGTVVGVNSGCSHADMVGQTERDDDSQMKRPPSKLIRLRRGNTIMPQDARVANATSPGDLSCDQSETAVQSRSASALSSIVHSTIDLISDSNLQPVVEVTTCQ